MMKKLHSAHVYLTDTKRNNVRYNTLQCIGSSGKGGGEAISVESLVQMEMAKISVVALVDDKEGSDADASSHGDSAPHHL